MPQAFSDAINCHPTGLSIVNYHVLACSRLQICEANCRKVSPFKAFGTTVPRFRYILNIKEIHYGLG
jgi:hypothetical protein